MELPAAAPARFRFFFFLLLLVMLTCQFFYLSKNKHVNVNKYKYVIWKQDSRQQFTAEELEKAHWAPNHTQTDRQTDDVGN